MCRGFSASSWSPDLKPVPCVSGVNDGAGGVVQVGVSVSEGQPSLAGK